MAGARRGIFKKHGLEVEVIATPSGVEGMSALIAGEITFLQIAGATTVSAAVGGADVVVIGTTIGTLVQNLMVRPEIEKSDKLRGKTADHHSTGRLQHSRDHQPQRRLHRDAAAAQVGGLGIAPGANIGDGFAVFEATHGTAPKYADKDVINPGSVILSGVMLLDFIGWKEAAKLIEDSMEKTIQQKFVTYDFERQTAGATKVGTSEFATRIIGNMTG